MPYIDHPARQGDGAMPRALIAGWRWRGAMKPLTPAQIKCLVAIREGRGAACLRGYRFQSADILWQRGLIYGDTGKPFWTWKLTGQGLWVLRLVAPKVA